MSIGEVREESFRLDFGKDGGRVVEKIGYDLCPDERSRFVPNCYIAEFEFDFFVADKCSSAFFAFD